MAYCLRFIFNSRKSHELRDLGPLSVTELDNALIHLIKLVLANSFAVEIKPLSESQTFKQSHILALNPLLDDNQIGGGRLQNANLPFDLKHPMLLPAKHHFTKILFRREHDKLHHACPQQLLYGIGQRFWPLSGHT